MLVSIAVVVAVVVVAVVAVVVAPVEVVVVNSPVVVSFSSSTSAWRRCGGTGKLSGNEDGDFRKCGGNGKCAGNECSLTVSTVLDDSARTTKLNFILILFFFSNRQLDGDKSFVYLRFYSPLSLYVLFVATCLSKPTGSISITYLKNINKDILKQSA